MNAIRPVSFVRVFILVMLLVISASFMLNAALAEDSTGSITGRVTRELNGAGIAGVTISIYDLDRTTLITSSQTDASGNYTVAGLAAGEYYVRTNNPYGLTDKYYNNVIDLPGWYLVSKKVSVIAGSTTTDINFTLAMPWSISGRVTHNADGKGIEGVYVSAIGNMFFKGLTDANGYYTITGLISGSYYLKTSNSSFFIDEVYDNAFLSSPTMVIVTDGHATTDINFGLDGRGSITGRVTVKSDGTGVQNATIYVYDADRNYVTETYSDDSGTYTIPGLLPGKYYLRVSNYSGLLEQYYNNVETESSATAVNVPSGSTVKDINFILKAPGYIKGRATRDSDGGGISRLLVYWYDEDWNLVGFATTDSSGNYSIPISRSGNYYVMAMDSSRYPVQYYNNTTSENSATAISVAIESTVSGIDFNFPTPARSISGRITRDTDGAGIRGITVVFYNCIYYTGASCGYLASSASAITDASGYYITTGLSANTYYVGTGNNLGYEDKYYDGKISSESATPILITSSTSATNINISLVHGGSISGRVTRNSNGTAVIGASVSAYTLKNNVWTYLKYASTDTHGYYTISGLSANDYYLSADSHGGQPVEYYDHVLSKNDAKKITVTLGEEITGINFGKKPFHSRDFNGDGKPDILWRNAHTGEMTAWFMNGTTHSTDSHIDTIAETTWAIAGLGDFNGDSKTDILWRNQSSGANAVWFMDGITKTGDHHLDPVADVNWKIAGTADFNNDGKTDILWRNSSSGANHVWYMDGTAKTDGADLETAADQNWTIAGVADFNGDTKPDILWRNISSGANYVWYMDGITRTDGDFLDPVADLNWTVGLLGDFDNDGKTDIVWRNTLTGENCVWYMNGPAATGYAYLEKVADLNWLIEDKRSACSPGIQGQDFNGDGKTDILWRNPSTGENALWFMNGVSFLDSAYLQNVPDSHWKITGTGDFNSDGKTDILWRNASTGENALWFMSGAAFLDSAYLQNVPDSNWKIAGTGDFNSDGKTDILWRNASTGENALWFMDGATWTGSTFLDPVPDLAWTIAGSNEQ